MEGVATIFSFVPDSVPLIPQIVPSISAAVMIKRLFIAILRS
jgi:hypothetical protein